MTHDDNTPTPSDRAGQPGGQPSPDPAPDAPPLFHPLIGAAAGMAAMLQPAMNEDAYLELIDLLNRSMIADGVDSPDDAAAILSTQARVLDSVFSRMIAAAFARPGEMPHFECLGAAMIAQRQCSTAIDRLKRHDLRVKDFKLKKDEKILKRTERRRNQL